MSDRPILAGYWTLAGDSALEFEGGDEISPLDPRVRIEAAAEAGYAGIGFLSKDLEHWREKYPPAAIKRALEESGLREVELEMLFDWYAEGERRVASDRVRADLLHWAEELGARYIKIGTEFSDAELDGEILIDEFGKLCEEASAAGTSIALEPMPVAPLRTPALAKEVIDGAGASNSGLLLDIWHVVRSGTPYEYIASLPADSIMGVEVCDAPAEPPNPDDLYVGATERQLCGEGGLGVTEFIAALDTAGFKGPIGIEMISTANRKRSLEVAAAENIAALRDNLPA